ncbi:MAG: HAD-IB family phosphatase [Planctomycetes bacterium]|nr:HAD-IB family phosphatase [Planctomycetota bacterium]
MASKLKLVAFDIEGTLTVNPTVWEIMHRKLGTWESHGGPYWQRFCEGEFDYDTFAKLDVAVWRGAPHDLLLESAREVGYVSGCAKVMRELHGRGIVICAISCGLDVLSQRMSDELGIDHHFANTALHDNGTLSGELRINVPYGEKGRVLRELLDRLGIAPENVAAVGDHTIDIPMFELSAVSIAFNSGEPETNRAATCSVTSDDLTTILEHLPLS